MVRALRVMTVERGVDPRKLALMAFGGAGGLHAAAIAEELGITKILCPRASGVLAALGLVVSERRRDAQRSVLLKAAELERRTGRARASGPARSWATKTPTCASSPSCATAARRSSWRSRSATISRRISTGPTRRRTATVTLKLRLSL